MKKTKLEKLAETITDTEINKLCEQYQRQTTKDMELKGIINYLYHHKRWENNHNPFRVGQWKMICDACQID